MEAVPYDFAEADASTIKYLYIFIPMIREVQSPECRIWKAAFKDHIKKRWTLHLEVRCYDGAWKYRFLKILSRDGCSFIKVRFEDVQKKQLKYLDFAYALRGFESSKDEITAIFKFIRPLLGDGVPFYKDQRSKDDYLKFVMDLYVKN